MATQHTPDLDADLFDYELPEEAIALHPAEPRSSANMLVWRNGQQNLNARFTDLPSVLPRDSQLWVNNTRVIRARLLLQKPTGGRLEVFLLEPMDLSMEQVLASTDSVKWKCMVKGAKRWSAGLATLQVEEFQRKMGGRSETGGNG